MTNNPTIDGVSRELIERLVNNMELNLGGNREALRALLDADKVNHREMGLMQFVEAHPVVPAVERQEPVEVVPSDNADQAFALMDFALSFALCNREHAGTRRDVKKAQAHLGALKDHTDALQSTIAQLQARVTELESGRGEPVAWRAHCVHPRAGKQSGLFDKKYQAENWAAHWRDACGLKSSFDPLFTAPPAPVAVVLPDHKDSDLRSPSYGYSRGWNDCLDATAALNGERK